MNYILQGSAMTSSETAQRHIAETLHFADWYGGNLDALFDLLTALTKPVVITLRDGDQMDAALGIYAQKLRRVFSDAAAQNSNIVLAF
ncbi:MAG: barstar family protein [Oscillospiraceae bacterium]|jgi:ribonuclease inhibitor